MWRKAELPDIASRYEEQALRQVGLARWTKEGRTKAGVYGHVRESGALARPGGLNGRHRAFPPVRRSGDSSAIGFRRQLTRPTPCSVLLQCDIPPGVLPP